MLLLVLLPIILLLYVIILLILQRILLLIKDTSRNKIPTYSLHHIKLYTITIAFYPHQRQIFRVDVRTRI